MVKIITIALKAVEADMVFMWINGFSFKVPVSCIS